MNKKPKLFNVKKSQNLTNKKVIIFHRKNEERKLS